MKGQENEIARLESLATYRRLAERVRAAWPEFQKRRIERLKPHPTYMEAPAEKVTEGILEDLFTMVLDWPISNLSPQVEHADFVLSDHGIRWIIIEAKRPGAFTASPVQLKNAIAQAAGYAASQRVQVVVVSDGNKLYAANVEPGGLKDRVYILLSADEPPMDLWWLSLQGIWRDRAPADGAWLLSLANDLALQSEAEDAAADPAALLHPKYKLPLQCFAYVKDAAKPQTWKLPYLQANGVVDRKRLPKAIQAILTDYRGVRVSDIPEEKIPEVLACLARAAFQTGHFDPDCADPPPVYKQLALKLEQVGIRIEDLQKQERRD